MISRLILAATLLGGVTLDVSGETGSPGASARPETQPDKIIRYAAPSAAAVVLVDQVLTGIDGRPLPGSDLEPLRATLGTSSAPTLAFVAQPGGVVEAGDLVVINLLMLGLGTQEAAGFQAFVQFDPAKLNFISAGYTDQPFGLPVIDPITAVGNTINLASGINQFVGQTPTAEDSLLVEMTFEVLEPGCVTGLTFRDHEPPTRISDILGNPIEPLKVVGLPDDQPSPDLNGDGQVNPVDLALLLGDWGPCIRPPSACCDADGAGGCQVLDEAECFFAGGQYLDGVDCSACPPASCGGASGDCCVDNGSPGCEDMDCCGDVCDVMPACCDTAWDAACATAAETLCPACYVTPANDGCAAASAIFDGATPYSTLGAGTDGSEEPACGNDDQIHHDIWYDYLASCSGTLVVDTCADADYDTELAIYNGCDCGTMSIMLCNDDSPACPASIRSQLTVAVDSGNCYKIRVGGAFPMSAGLGTLSVACGGGLVTSGGTPIPFACPADLNCDGVVNPIDLAILLGSWGPVNP